MNAGNADMASSANESVDDVLDSIERRAHRGQCWMQHGDSKPIAVQMKPPPEAEGVR